MRPTWAALTRDIGRLRRLLLPNPFHPFNDYPRPELVQVTTRAFLVLSHAEIETYLEEWAKHIAKACEAVWKRSQRIPVALGFLVGTLGKDVRVSVSLSGKDTQDSRQRFADMIDKLFEDYYKTVNQNNGVKELNVLRLFDPLGVPAEAYGANLLFNLDNLGEIRGKHAHNSSKAVKSVLSPEDEHNRVTAVLKELEGFEQWLVAYRRSIR